MKKGGGCTSPSLPCSVRFTSDNSANRNSIRSITLLYLHIQTTCHTGQASPLETADIHDGPRFRPLIAADVGAVGGNGLRNGTPRQGVSKRRGVLLDLG